MISSLREEIAEQISALKGMKEMAAVYGYDISQPAKNAKEAVQWLYFGYLAADQDTERCSYERWPCLYFPWISILREI